MNRFESKQALRNSAPRAIERLLELLESKNERTALQAAKLVLLGAFGPPGPKTSADELVKDACLDDESFGHRVDLQKDRDRLWGDRPAPASAELDRRSARIEVLSEHALQALHEEDAEPEAESSEEAP